MLLLLQLVHLCLVTLQTQGAVKLANYLFYLIKLHRVLVKSVLGVLEFWEYFSF